MFVRVITLLQVIIHMIWIVRVGSAWVGFELDRVGSGRVGSLGDEWCGVVRGWVGGGGV